MAAARQHTEVKVIRQGWCVKESGNTFMGQYNWRRRWFSLVYKGSDVTLSYYRNQTDKQPAGSVRLDKTLMLTLKATRKDDCTRELEIGEKSKPHCFAVGPLIDNGAVRTYFMSCESEQDKLEWMAVIDATIEGVPERAEKRRQTIALKHRSKTAISKLPMSAIPEDNQEYLDHHYRLDRWHRLCQIATTGQWKKIDTKDDITVARFTFKEQSMVVIKIDGVASATKDVVFTFLQRSTRQGGKLDYPFRHENVLQEIEGDLPGNVFYCQYPVPLPRISPRLVCAVRTWVPEYCTRNGTSGLLVFSVDHPGLPKMKGMERAEIQPSGIILTAERKPDGKEVTRLTVVAQLDAQKTLQRMLRGAYKSGLLKIGIRSGFQHICQHLRRQMELFDV